MNERKPRKSEKTSTGKGIYAAIYGSVAIMLLIAAVIGVNNLLQSPANTGQEPGIVEATDDPAVADVGSSLDEPIILEPRDEYTVRRGEEDEEDSSASDDEDEDTSAFDEEDDIESRRRPAESEVPSDAPSETPSEKPGNEATEKPTASPKPEKPTSESETGTTSAGLEPNYEAFKEGDTMIWPLEGEILMGFSMNHLIYDSTLEQYRTNGNICISGELDDHVRAAAAGVVTESFNSRRGGRTVTIFHGNGWSTNYSQLQDNVEVKVGDVVEQGQLIGMLGDPSIYSQQLGNHLEFSVTREEDLVDPIAVLVRNQ